MRAKSVILLILALGCGLVAAIGVTQVISKKPAPTPQGDTLTIVVAAKDLKPGELISPEMVKLDTWPREKVPEGSLTEIAKVDGCRARADIYQGEPVQERKLLGKGFTRQTATDYIPKGYRVVGVKVDIASGAGLIQPGDRVDVLVHVARDTNRGIPDNRTQTILQDIKVFAVDNTFKIDPGANAEDTIQAKVIQLLVTPQQAETLVLAQQLGKVQLTMRPPGGEDVVKTTGKTPAELLGRTEAGNRAQENADDASQGGDMLAFLKGMTNTPAPPATQPVTQPAAKPQANSWSIRVLSGSELSDVTMEESTDASGEHFWRVSSGQEAAPEPAAVQEVPPPAQSVPPPSGLPGSEPIQPSEPDAGNSASSQPAE